MPRVEITVATVSRSGVAPGTQHNADATNDHYIANNDGRIWLEIVSTDGSDQTVTFETPVTVDGLNLEDVVVTIPAGTTRLVGPFPTPTFNQTTPAADVNKVFVNPSVSTTLKFRGFKI